MSRVQKALAFMKPNLLLSGDLLSSVGNWSCKVGVKNVNTHNMGPLTCYIQSTFSNWSIHLPCGPWSEIPPRYDKCWFCLGDWCVQTYCLPGELPACVSNLKRITDIRATVSRWLTQTIMVCARWITRNVSEIKYQVKAESNLCLSREEGGERWITRALLKSHVNEWVNLKGNNCSVYPPGSSYIS